MSVSSHLTPDPERRLRLIHGNIQNSLRRLDWQLGAATFFAAGQMAVIKITAPEGLLTYIALLALCAAVPAGLLGASPFIETLRRIPLLEPRENKQYSGGSLVNDYDIARYSQAELVNFLDRYLGGGVTATPYYEDIVAQIVIGARVATRKRRLFGAACVLAGLAQLCLFARLILR